MLSGEPGPLVLGSRQVGGTASARECSAVTVRSSRTGLGWRQSKPSPTNRVTVGKTLVAPRHNGYGCSWRLRSWVNVKRGPL